MAGYNIVLDIGGNAVSRSEKLAANLGVAAANATTLAAALRSVGTAAAAVPARTIRVGAVPTGSSIRGRSYAADNGRFREYIQGMTRQSDVMRSMARYYKEQERDARARYTRHRNTKIMSYGTGFNLGGFSGRFSTILQPDVNGNILGMNAATLMKNVNTAAIATSIVGMVGKAVIKTMAYSTAAPFVIGGIGMKSLISMLQSEGFASGVRLISRRAQAQAGLGSAFERAQSNADALAASYGLDRSTSLSSINVLTGLGVGGSSDQKLSLGQATRLTKIGGLISQQAGVPFERVMTNIQQLLVQATPNIRDIRELLNQAPVLGKYALKEMEERGVKGTDVRTYLKDQGALLSTLARYEIDNVSNAGMRARGEIALAQQDFWAKIAGQDKVWNYVGTAGQNLIGAGGNAVTSLLSTLTENKSFQTMVNRMVIALEDFSDSGVKLVDKLITFIERASEKLGLEVGDPYKAMQRGERERYIRGMEGDSTVTKQLRMMADTSGYFKGLTPELREREFEQLRSMAINRMVRDTALRNSIQLRGELYGPSNPMPNPLYDPNDPEGFHTRYTILGRGRRNLSTARDVYNKLSTDTTAVWKLTSPALLEDLKRKGGLRRNPDVSATMAGATVENINAAAIRAFREVTGSGSADFSKITGASGEPAGSDLSGFNKDRRNLEIHFHDAIVKWTSNISTDDPQEVVAEVKQNIDQIASEAIQKAMLAATGKMGTRWI